MNNAPVKAEVKGQAEVKPKQEWSCVRCGRQFKVPKIPKTCETLFSICFTCFAISCMNDIEQDSPEKA